MNTNTDFRTEDGLSCAEVDDWVDKQPAPEKKPKQCLLPGCDNMTKHNGGYCCGEHCKEHQRK